MKEIHHTVSSHVWLPTKTESYSIRSVTWHSNGGAVDLLSFAIHCMAVRRLKTRLKVSLVYATIVCTNPHTAQW